MTRAIASGVLDAQAVITDARRQADRQVAPMIPLGTLARYDRPAPALDAYDQRTMDQVRPLVSELLNWLSGLLYLQYI